MQNFADAMNEPYQNRWAKYIELLIACKLKDSRKENPKFPHDEGKDIIKEKKEWMNEVSED